MHGKVTSQPEDIGQLPFLYEKMRPEELVTGVVKAARPERKHWRYGK